MIKKYKVKLIALLQKCIKGLEYVVGLTDYLKKALKYLRKILAAIKVK